MHFFELPQHLPSIRARGRASQEGFRNRMSAHDGARDQKSSLIMVPNFD